MKMKTKNEYPISLTIDYPKRPLDKVSTFFRIFTAIPIWIILALLLAGGRRQRNSIFPRWLRHPAHPANAAVLPKISEMVV